MDYVLDFFKKRILSIVLKTTSIFSDRRYGEFLHKKLTGNNLNLDNPVTFNDKLWWLKLNDRNPLLTKCTDKYTVREYVQECGLKHILNDMYGVYKSPEEIDFSDYDHEVFIKCNHGSGSNLIYNPNKAFDKKYFINLFDFQLRQNYYLNSREWNYKNIEPKIIVERVLRDKQGNLPNDYKFLCFNGEPKLMFYDTKICMENGRKAASGKRNIYDMDFNLIDLKINRDNFEKKDEMPENFEEMKRYAAILSKGFPHVRVDFYNFDGRVFFGEMTFYNHGGCNIITPIDWEKRLGDWIELSSSENNI